MSYCLQFGVRTIVFKGIIAFIQQGRWKCITVCTKILSSATTLIIRSFSWAANQHIRMIYEVSCDTDNWWTDAENSALPSWEYIIFYNKCK